MEKINFVFGIHNHQPIGNFDFVIEHAYKKSYLPFLKILSEFPKIKVSLHNSGYLFEFLINKHPEYKEILTELIENGQIELLSGGFYEPIFPSIPEADRRNQILKLTRFIEDNFSVQPQGMWLSERVWEQSILKDLRDVGIKFTILDDEHFLLTGLRAEELYGYYITEYESRTLFLFPISKKLRYLVPFKSPQETLEFFKSIRGRGDLVVLADDGEKFGVWPGTYDLVYTKGWLREFFSMLSENSDWIEMLTFSESLEKFSPRKLIYLPEASYHEMMEWALPPNFTLELQEAEEIFEKNEDYKIYKKFLRGTFWRNFLVKYDEANNMHKRMVDISNRSRKLIDERKDHSPYSNLLKAQANDAYWHGVFGGLYLPHLRSNIYRNLIKAEEKLDKAYNFGKRFLFYEEKDLDKDGQKEVILKNNRVSLFFKPSYGGTIFEIDYRPKSLNITDTLRRRFEAYHNKIENAQLPGNEEGKSIHEILVAKERDLEEYLIYDWHNKYSLMDHFLREDTNIENFYKVKYGEQGDFTILPYTYSIEKDKDMVRLSQQREGHIWIGDKFLPLTLKKDVMVFRGEDILKVDYSFKNTSYTDYNIWFGTEFNFSLFERDNPKKYLLYPDGKRSFFNQVYEKKELEEFTIYDEVLGLKINFFFDIPIMLWHYPVDTVSQSEAGFERTFQALGILVSIKKDLSKNEIFSLSFNIKLENI